MELADEVDCVGTKTWRQSMSGSSTSLLSELSVKTYHGRLCGTHCSWTYDAPSACEEWWGGSTVTFCQVSSPAELMLSLSTGTYKWTDALLFGPFTSSSSLADSPSTAGTVLPSRRDDVRRCRQHRCITYTTVLWPFRHWTGDMAVATSYCSATPNILSSQICTCYMYRMSVMSNYLRRLLT